MAAVECSNCSTPSGGAARRLVLEQNRDLEISLCNGCFDELVAEEWIEARP